MSMKFVCDLCKVEMGTHNRNTSSGLCNYNKIFFARDKTAFVHEDGIYDNNDLCGDCVDKIRKFIKNGGMV